MSDEEREHDEDGQPEVTCSGGLMLQAMTGGIPDGQ